MSEKPQDLNTLGIELESNRFKGVQLYLKKGVVFLEKLFCFSFEQDNVNPLYKETNFQATINSTLVVSSLKTEDVLIRPLELKLKKEKDIQDVLIFSAEPLLPYPVDNAVIDAIIIGPKEDDSTLLTVFAVRKDHLESHLNNLKKTAIEPESVICEPLSLCCFANYFCKEHQNIYIVHIGLETTTCLLLEDGKLIAAKSAELGTNSFNENTIDNESAKTYFLEIKRLLFSLTTLANFDDKNLLVVGPGANIPEIAVGIENDLSLYLVKPNVSLLNNITEEQLNDFSIPLGSALNGLPLHFDRLNFRKKEFSYPHPWKRLKKPLTLFSTLSFLIALSFYIFSLSYTSYQVSHIKADFLNLLSAMNTSFEEFEPTYEKKLNILDPLPLSQLSLTDISERIDFIENIIENTPQSYALLPMIPRVSDVLAWLSTLLAGKDSSKTNPITIENFNYSLIKRPEFNKKQEKYQVKVEFEFISKTPKEARELHDILIAPNDFIDPKGEIKWNVAKGRYKTSFYLKDKTTYP